MADERRKTEFWHSPDEQRFLGELDATREGLSTEQAERRLAEVGPNALQAEKPPSLAHLALKQIANPLIYLLFGSAIVSLLAGKRFDALVIGGIVLANTVIGLLQEWRAEKALEALRNMSAPKARVLRDGDMRLVAATEVVPGDVLVLETGDRVGADARVLDANELRVDESALTGESEPLAKEPGVLAEDVALADRSNMVWMTSPVVAGRGLAMVVATGMRTQVGEIASEVQAAGRQETPLQRQLGKLSTWLGAGAIAFAALIFGLGVATGHPLTEMLLFAVATAVSAIPEGLPTVVTVVLALGVQRMARRNAIVRRLAAVETLGSTTTVCSDKTGTITRNQMTVTRAWTSGRTYSFSGSGFDPSGEVLAEDGGELGADLDTLLSVGCVANNARLERENGGWTTEGNPTEAALLVASHKRGLHADMPQCDVHRLDEIPFSSQFKYMATLDRTAEGARLHVKGAPDRLIEWCTHVLRDGQAVPLDDAGRAELQAANDAFANDALRVIAAAYRDLPSDTTEADRADAESGLTFVGMWGLLDPPREEAIAAVAAAQRAGIAVKMITGDHATTAAAIARKVGILHEGESVVTGGELDRMSEEELRDRVRAIAVFARVEPRHKIRIVKALQSHGEIVSMTGDGVNDAAALRRADIGVAMGITGTEVSKEAADMILADDDFATIIVAVEEGRLIFGNLRRVVTFLVTISLGEVLTILAALAIGMPLPLTAIMILWVNLVTAGVTVIPLGMEPKHEDLLSDPPRAKGEGILPRRTAPRIGVAAVLVAIGVLSVYAYYLDRQGLVHARTMAFTTLVAFEWTQALASRSDRLTIFELGLFSNRWLLLGLAIGAVMQSLAVYWPFAENAFGTERLELYEWGVALGVALSLLVVLEAWKLLRRRGARQGANSGK